MKKYLLIFAAIGSIAITSCKNETKNEDPEVVSPEDGDIMESDVNPPEIACYRYVSEKDTVLLQMEKMNDDVAGTLSYNYFEKDKNDGTFEGIMVGDTLKADYTFESEGSVSVRELIFIKKENKLVEGYGELEQVAGKIKFKKKTKFNFNYLMPLEEVNCD
ncbi:hypothetical protein Aeqsu_0239 [Aequorivita sublithincola DSM 14238]|uniref:Uncharacterized protein n=1 Tax=Aequorivita sublithincola (strain DSM 14238 / LMG 21431 / ACAM 643 / 9-3) TaxID=746697 RepID=I3YRZ4_AEQSU|nr:hypothetical protein [Aequorivita sublithincola]AFL79762.1 hypothetical protein Aeqsu_0239 [Aequorivita sublithincola DSM 14238]